MEKGAFHINYHYVKDTWPASLNGIPTFVMDTWLASYQEVTNLTEVISEYATTRYFLLPNLIAISRVCPLLTLTDFTKIIQKMVLILSQGNRHFSL